LSAADNSSVANQAAAVSNALSAIICHFFLRAPVYTEAASSPRFSSRIRQLSWAKWFVVVVFGLHLVGCGGSVEQQQEEESTLRALAITYGRYVAQHRGQPPQNEVEFKKYVEAQRPEDLNSLGVSEPAKIWVSSRDKQPYVVLYGTVTGPPGPAGQPVIAYEAKGVGGQRLVASQLGAVEEVTDARFQELVPSAAPAP
jgi:hypothetical protein